MSLTRVMSTRYGPFSAEQRDLKAEGVEHLNSARMALIIARGIVHKRRDTVGSACMSRGEDLGPTETYHSPCPRQAKSGWCL